MTEAQAPSSKPTGNTLLRNRLALIIAILVTVAGLCLVCLFVILLLNPFEGSNLAGLGGGGETPTPFPTGVITGTPSTEAVIFGLSNSTPITLSLNSPLSMFIGDQNFLIRSQPVNEDGSWQPELDEGKVAAWVYGTVINYLVGMANNDTNRQVLESLNPGDEIFLKLRDGATYTFAVSKREVVSPGRTDFFAQSRPALTIILLGNDGEDRLIVQADFTASDGAGSGATNPAGNVVELGEVAQLADLQVMVSGATSLFGRPEAPNGFVFYLVNFQVDNVGPTPVDSGQLQMTLTDDLGNQYALNVLASQLGNNPPLSGFINGGESRLATAGYQIPAGLTSTNLRWSIAFQNGNGQVQVNIPFGGSDSQNALVLVQSADVSLDGTSLSLIGQISNGGSQPLIVNETDISLTSAGTVYLLFSTNPPFPWVVPAGQPLPFAVTFQRPAGSDAIFTLLSQPFQLTGLR